MNFVRDAGRHDGNGTCFIKNFGTVIDTFTGTGNDLMRFQLCFMDMVLNASNKLLFMMLPPLSLIDILYMGDSRLAWIKLRY